MDSQLEENNREQPHEGNFDKGSKTDGLSATEEKSKGKESESNQMSVEDIESAMQQMFDEIKRKRENDFAILEEVKKEIIAQAKRSCEVLEQHMADMHAAKGKEIDEKWSELANVLNRIKESESEMEKTKNSLSLLCKADSEQ